MENMIISLNTVLPMFLIIGVGYLAKHCRIISPGAVKEANALCFRCFMSVLMFNNIYSANLSTAFNGPLLLFCVGCLAAEFLLAILLVPRIESAPPKRGVMAQSLFRSNLALLLIPLTSALFGQENVGLFSIVMTVLVPLYNVLAVIVLELYRGGKPTPRNILRGVCTNPLILGAVTGILVRLLHLSLPTVLATTVRNMAGATTPMALALLGASLDLNKIRASSRNLFLCVAARLIVLPGVFSLIAVLLGFRGMPLAAVLLAFGTPVAVATYTMSVQMDGDGDLAAGIVMFSTIGSCFTLFLWIWLMKSLALF